VDEGLTTDPHEVEEFLNIEGKISSYFAKHYDEWALYFVHKLIVEGSLDKEFLNFIQSRIGNDCFSEAMMEWMPIQLEIDRLRRLHVGKSLRQVPREK
jgi:hypothetical protein